jgi:hypothetical protein
MKETDIERSKLRKGSNVSVTEIFAYEGFSNGAFG